MATEQTGIPTRAEIERQLKRVLADKRLKRSQRRSTLLDYVVRKTLRNEEITENIIGYDLFPRYAPDESGKVRVTANQLRHALSVYYSEEGANDPVRIELPPGPGYRPTFAYSPGSGWVSHFRRGMEYLKSLSYGDLVLARQEFFRVAQENPAYAPAYAAQADAALRLQLIGRSLVEHNCPALDFTEIEETAARAVKLDATHWHGHYMLAVARACLWQWKDARKHFKKAVTLSSEECKSGFWYGAIHLSLGGPDDGIQAAVAAARQNPESIVAQLTAGALLYLSSDPQGAKPFLQSAFSFNRDSWQVRLLLTMADMSLGDFEEADRYLRPRSFSAELGARKMEGAFPGVVAYYLAQVGDRAAARTLLLRLKRADHGKPEQLAIAHAALGQEVRAIECLGKLADERHPLMLWAHLLPVFGALAKHPAFSALTMRMSFPRRK